MVPFGLPDDFLRRARADRSFFNYYALSNELAGHARSADGRVESTISLAFLGNVTLEPLARYLKVACVADGFWPAIYEAPYGQHARALLEGSSDLYSFRPDLAILFLDHAELLPESAAQESFARGLSLVSGFARCFERECNGILLIHNLVVPTRTALGNLELCDRSGLTRMTARFNEELAALFEADPRCFVVDLDSLLAEHGKRAAIDAKMGYIGRLPFAFDFVPALADQYLAYIKAVRGYSRKCIVVDADNTLWGGVVGEDGLAGIALGPTPPGNAYLAFQQLLLRFFKRGIILALNSRNNPDDIKAVLEGHPNQALKHEHFAAIRVNWETKSANLAAISKELNIGLDSMVFVDDDPFNRAEVREAWPQVRVLDLPSDPAGYCDALLAVTDFCALSLTGEDRRRGELYAAERLRSEAREAFQGTGEYLRNLNMVVQIDILDDFAIPRASQLCLRTNQFNATTRRYTEGDIRRMHGSPEWILLKASLRDRYGDSGLIGLCFVNIERGAASIDTFLMSCRALGRGIEDALLRDALVRAKERAATHCLAEVRFTAKNLPVREYYEQRGFNCLSRTETSALWQISLACVSIEVPDYLTIDNGHAALEPSVQRGRQAV